jgi:NADPH-dependent curcumin reductase CurA
MSLTNQLVTLVNRPTGALKLDDFKLEQAPVPEIRDGEVLLRTICFSIDPYMRFRMNEGDLEGESFKLGSVIEGASICSVEQSKNPDLKVGDLVLADTGWQTYAVFKGDVLSQGFPFAGLPGLKKISKDVKSSYYLGALGMPGFTGFYALMAVGEPKPGETVVISAATGAVGSMAGQLAKLKGCRVVGIAGGETKCRYAVQELGFDACIDHKSKSFAKNLKAACPNGIDIYVENVGGSIFWTVLELFNENARIPIIGGIAWYNSAAVLIEPGFKLRQIFPKIKALLKMLFNVDRSPLLFMLSIGKRLKLQGLVITDHLEGYNDFLKEITPLIQSGKIKIKEDVVKGIDHAPKAFISLLEGKNFGKLVIEV